MLFFYLCFIMPQPRGGVSQAIFQQNEACLKNLELEPKICYCRNVYKRVRKFLSIISIFFFLLSLLGEAIDMIQIRKSRESDLE